MKKILPILVIFWQVNYVSAQVVMNEVMSNNQSVVMDDYENYSDWIEFYNPTLSLVNLQGYFLSDNADSLTKWRIPNFTIPAGGYNTIWCSGVNDTNGNNLHTNFAINTEGETIYLSDGFGNIIDNIAGVLLVPDKTFGRWPDGTGNSIYLSVPTFKSTNNAASAITGIITDVPDFSVPGGFYLTDQNISLTHPDQTVNIHYTLDGSDPDESSPVFTSPINVHSRVGEPNYYSMIRTCYNVHPYLPDWNPPPHEVYKCSVVRARALKSGFFPGPIQTYTYFIDPAIFARYGNLPVVSVVSDPKNLFNDTTGIYVPGISYIPGTFHANYYNDWDRTANIEMYMPGGIQAFNGTFKISINGQSSPSSPQKGLNVTASPDYGPSKIEYPLFQNRPFPAKYINKFDKVKLRAWGSDRAEVLYRDAYSASIMAKTGMDLEAYQPCVVFIDGEYWGLHEMRERNRNGEYYQSHYFIDNKNPGFDILDGAGNSVIEGDAVHWDAMTAFLNTNSLAFQPNYEYIKTQLDVNSFMLNYMASIYFARGDWPDQNEAKWRPRIPGGKWKWIQWDMDNTAGYYLNEWYNMFFLAMNGSRGYGPSVLLNQLLANQSFKNDFINLFADYMNTEFLPPLANNRVISMRDELMPFFPEFRDRWQTNFNWQTKINEMTSWLTGRPQYVKQQIMSTFALPGIFNLTLDVSDTLKGRIKVNTVKLDENTTRITSSTFPWTGQYFNGVPVPLTAMARPGYQFAYWLPSGDTSATISVSLFSDTTLTAVFDFDPNYIPVISPMINEVMSSNTFAIADNYGEFDDWLEIYNPNNDTLDLAGYFLTDNMVLPTRWQFASGTDSTKVPPLGHLLVWIDDDTEQGVLHTGFKFNATGDFIALVKPDGETIADSVSFGFLPTDASYGRSYDGGPLFIQFYPSTPGQTNQSIGNEYIAVNELQTMNVSTVVDNYNEYDPWIELYNPSPDTVNIAGWKISNDPTNTVVYTFPHGNDTTKIAPYGFKLVWADNQTDQGIMHTNFVLQSTGCVSLLKANFGFTDSVCYNSLAADKSYGRIDDGNPLWRTFAIPTPDSNNWDLTTVGDNIEALNKAVHVYPNPVTGSWLYVTHSTTFSIIDALGRELLFVRNSNFCDVSMLEKGVYFLRTKDGSAVKIIRE